MNIGEGVHGSVVGPHELGEVFHSSAALVLDDSFGCVLKSHNQPDPLVRAALDMLEASRRERLWHVRENRRVAECYRASRATEVVACAFETGAPAALGALRRAWVDSLGAAVRKQVEDWAAAEIGEEQIVAVWCRGSAVDTFRNMTTDVANRLVQAVRNAGLRACLFGNQLERVDADLDLRQLWTKGPFAGSTSFRAQLYMFDWLVRRRLIVAAIGAKSGAMDGPALLGVRTLYLEHRDDPKARRMEKWIGPVPAYRRVRCETFLRGPHAGGAAGQLTEGELAEVAHYLKGNR